MAGSEQPAVPGENVITNAKEGAEAFGEWWANLSTSEQQAIADAHGEKAREVRNRRRLTD